MDRGLHSGEWQGAASKAPRRDKAGVGDRPLLLRPTVHPLLGCPQEHRQGHISFNQGHQQDPMAPQGDTGQAEH